MKRTAIEKWSRIGMILYQVALFSGFWIIGTTSGDDHQLLTRWSVYIFLASLGIAFDLRLSKGALLAVVAPVAAPFVIGWFNFVSCTPYSYSRGGPGILEWLISPTGLKLMASCLCGSIVGMLAATICFWNVLREDRPGSAITPPVT